MKKTKFYSVFAAIVIAMFVAIAAAVAFVVPGKGVAKADEAAKVYDYEILTGPEDTARQENDVYFGISMPASVKPGETFEVSIALLNRKDGILTVTLPFTFSIGFTVNSSTVPDATKALFGDTAIAKVSENSPTKPSKVNGMYAADEGQVIKDSFIELAVLSVTVDDIISPTGEDDSHYYMALDWSGTVTPGVSDEEDEDIDARFVHYTSFGEGGDGDGINEDAKGYEIIVKSNASEDVEMAVNNPSVTANNTALNGELEAASQEWDETKSVPDEGAPGIGGMRHTTYQTYKISSLLAYSTESITVTANANDSNATVKMLTNPEGTDELGDERYTVVDSNTYTFDISELTPDLKAGGPEYETDSTGNYYKYTLSYIYKVFAEANGYVRVYSITFYREKEPASEYPLTLNSVKLVSVDNLTTYDTTYDEATKTYTVVDGESQPLTISYVDAKANDWRNWKLVAERTYTGSEVTTTGDDVVTLQAGANQFTITVSSGDEDSETYFVKVNVAEANTDKSLASVIIKNKNVPSHNRDITESFNSANNTYTAEIDADTIGETWMVDVTATKVGFVEVSYTVQETVLKAGVNYLYVTVTDQLGVSTNYTVIITVTANSDTTLSVFKAGLTENVTDATDLVKAAGDVNYSYKISDTVGQFYLFVEATDDTSTVTVRNDGVKVDPVSGKYLIVVNLSETVTEQRVEVTVLSQSDTSATYTVVVTRLSSDATLKSVYIENATGKKYVAEISGTTVTISGVAYRDSLNPTAWTLYVEANNAGATYTASRALTSFTGNTIEVTPETGAADKVTYTVVINVIPGDENTKLSRVYITNGTDTLTANEFDHDAKIVVINGMTYAQSLDTWTLYAETESALATCTTAVQLTSLDGNKITVTPDKGEPVEYTVIINRASISTDSNVIITVKAGTQNIDLTINGNTYSAVVNYDNITSVTVYVSTAELSTVKFDGVETKSKELTLSVGDTKTTITVTAESGATSEYIVIISAYTENVDADTDEFITITGDAKGSVSQSEYLSKEYILKDKSVKYRVYSFSIKISVPEYIKVKIAFGSNITLISSADQTASLAAAAPNAQNGTNVVYTARLKNLRVGNNAITLELTDTRTGISKIFVQNVYKQPKSNGALIAFLIIFLLLFLAVTVLFILSVLGIIDIKKIRVVMVNSFKKQDNSKSADADNVEYAADTAVVAETAATAESDMAADNDEEPVDDAEAKKAEKAEKARLGKYGRTVRNNRKGR